MAGSHRVLALGARALLALALLAPSAAGAISYLTIIGGIDSQSRVDDTSGGGAGQSASWPTNPPKKFETEIVGFNSSTGVQTLKIKNLALQQTSGGLGNFYTFTFNPGPLGDANMDFELDDNGGTATLPELIAYRDTDSGHFWTDPFTIRATRQTIVSAAAGAHYTIFLTTDETGAATGHAALPTNCLDPSAPSSTNFFEVVGNGKPKGVSGPSVVGNTIGADKMILAGVGCPLTSQAWPATDSTMDKSGVIFNLVAVPEPSISAMLAWGLGGLAWMGRRRKV